MQAESPSVSSSSPVAGRVASPPPSSPEELTQKLTRLRAEARTFARLPPKEKSALLLAVRARFFDLSPRMVELGCKAKGIDSSSPLTGEEWFSGPVISLRALRVYAEALSDIARQGAPRIDLGDIEQLPNGKTRVRATPRGTYDRLLFPGWVCDTWLDGSVAPRRVPELQARFYRQREPDGRVTLVLGAGNVASISILDILYHSFVEGAVCLLKMSPVNAYLGPLFEAAFEPLVARGFLAFAHGGPDVGAFLCEHELVDHVHITGAAETHDRIVWGPASERDERKRSNRPLLNKPVTSELGNVSPVLVVPGTYADSELDALARHIAGMVMQNASFNCNAAKMIVTARGFAQRDELLDRLSALFAREPARLAYYPGAADRYSALVPTTGARVQRFGDASGGKLPWTLISGLESDSHSPLFRVEPFCSVISETQVGSSDPVEFLAAATEFANQRLWGTLNAMLFIEPRLERDTTVGRALDAAIDGLRYGTVAVNIWPAVAYGLVNPPWGGHPSSTLTDVQSGIGWGHNALLLDGVEKAVLRGPIIGFPEPLWFPGHRHLPDLGRAMARMEAEPRPTGVLAAAWAAIRK